MALIFKHIYASIIPTELGFGNNDKTSTFKEVNDLPHNHIVNKNIRDLHSKFGIENVSIKNQWLPDMYQLPKINKTPSLLNPRLL